MQPVFSIIIPIYNAEKYLYQCIDSVLNQQFKNYELWLIDDGSSDSSISIIKEYAAKDGRIKTAFIKGSGPSIPRNYGLRRAKGKYILFIDSDDYLTEGALSVFNEKINHFVGVDYIRANQRILVHDKGELESVFALPRSKYANKIINGEDFMVDVLTEDYAPINALYRTDFLRENEIEFNEEISFLEDGPFIVELCRNAPKCVFINEETYVYRLGNPESVTNTPTNFTKCLSLIKGASSYMKAIKSYSEKGKNVLQTRAVEHAVSALGNSCRYLSNKESKYILNEMKSVFRRLPVLGRSRNQKISGRIYNLNPDFAWFLFRIFKVLLRHVPQ